MLHRSNPPTIITTPCYETSSTHGELAFVVRVADPAGALVHAGGVFQDLGGPLAVGDRGVMAVHPEGGPAVLWVDTRAAVDHPSRCPCKTVVPVSLKALRIE